MYTWFLLIILRIIYQEALIFRMLIGLDRDMTQIDIEVKGQGQNDHFGKIMVPPNYLVNCLLQRFHISHDYWSW